MVRTKDGGAKQNEWNVKVSTTTAGGEDSVVQYDSRARPIRWWRHGPQAGSGDAAAIVQEIVFDELGEHVARRSLPVDEALPAESRHYAETTYDPIGRLRTHTTPWKATTTYEYEGKDVLVTDPLRKITTRSARRAGAARHRHRSRGRDHVVHLRPLQRALDGHRSGEGRHHHAA